MSAVAVLSPVIRRGTDFSVDTPEGEHLWPGKIRPTAGQSPAVLKTLLGERKRRVHSPTHRTAAIPDGAIAQRSGRRIAGFLPSCGIIPPDIRARDCPNVTSYKRRRDDRQPHDSMPFIFWLTAILLHTG